MVSQDGFVKILDFGLAKLQRTLARRFGCSRTASR